MCIFFLLRIENQGVFSTFRVTAVNSKCQILELRHGAGLKLRMKNNQEGFNFNFLRDDSKYI